MGNNMQDIRETYNGNGQLGQSFSRLVGKESKSLSDAFRSRHDAAVQRQDERLAQGIDCTLEIKETRRIGRNDPCPCGSNVKFKKCCGRYLSESDTRVAE